MTEEYGFTETVTVTNVAKSVQRRLTVLIAMTVVLALGLSGTVIYVYTSSTVNRQALCTFRADVEARAKATRQLIGRGGFPGLSTATLQTSVEGQERTVRALSALPC